MDEIPLSFESPESSTISDASYDEDNQVLTINFRDGSTYTYPGFPPLEWSRFLESTSKGKYFSTVIRPIYTGRSTKAPVTQKRKAT